MATKQIPLTQGKFAIVDEEDFEYLNQWKWFYYKHKNTATGYAARNRRTDSAHRTHFTMHRQILGDKEKHEIDHIDGNGLNNSRKNLRHCTRSQNQHNRNKYKNNTSGYKGVSFDKQSGKYCVNIQINKVQKKIGRYKTAEEAHEAYQKAALELHGEFAKW